MNSWVVRDLHDPQVATKHGLSYAVEPSDGWVSVGVVLEPGGQRLMRQVAEGRWFLEAESTSVGGITQFVNNTDETLNRLLWVKVTDKRMQGRG